jgi:hypothetical protein
MFGSDIYLIGKPRQIILKWIWYKLCGCGLDSSSSGYGCVVVCFEHGNEPPGSVKFREFLDQLSDCQLTSTVCSHSLRVEAICAVMEVE